MPITIDQDALCESCSHKDKKSREGMMLCEGRYCEEARESYMEDHGLVEDAKTIFGNIEFGDTLYIVSDTLHKLVVRSAMFTSGHVKFEFVDSDISAMASTSSSSHCGFIHGSIFINKKEALVKYEDMMVVKIKEMAMTIAKFS